jgi:hypothetical protein
MSVLEVRDIYRKETLIVGFLCFRMLPPPLKKKKVEESPNDIPDVLQGEIARLDQRFKVCIYMLEYICWNRRILIMQDVVILI